MKNKKGLVFVAILLLGIGFAAVTTTLYINGNVNISSNSEDFDVKFTSAVIDNEDRTSEVISVDGKTINFTTKELQVLNDKSVLDFEVTNNSSLYDAEVSIECTSGEKSEYYQITKDVASIIPAKTTGLGKIEVQKIKMIEENIEEAFTCTLTANAKERTTKGEIIPVVNKNIEKAYEYNSETCLTGEESTCIETTCYLDKISRSCAPGTIIKYNVSDTLTKYFHVLHDDGDTMTLQQRENTVYNIAWYTEADNTKGPITILPALEEAVSGWTNVNTLNYQMGTTNFNGTNAFTGCSSYNNCSVNTYTLGARSGKARMITLQEATALGCTLAERSCPIWMYNYLMISTNYGGTVNDTYTGDGESPNAGYWTMSADSSTSYRVWLIRYYGRVNYNNSPGSLDGARAVIEINKYI